MWVEQKITRTKKHNTKLSSENAGQRAPPFNIEFVAHDSVMTKKLYNTQLSSGLFLPISFQDMEDHYNDFSS